MNRRDLLKMIAVATGGAMIGGEFFLSGCKNPEAGSLEFTEEDIAFLDEVAETIFPQTSSAGAKAAGVGAYMTVMVNDCYTQNDQEVFHKGIGLLNDACKKMHGHGFMKATPEQRKELLIAIDNERKEYQKKKSDFDNAERQKEEQKTKIDTLDFNPKKTIDRDTVVDRSSKEQDKQEMKPLQMPNHYFQMMKQLTISGYFTSEKGIRESLRYTPVPGKFEGVIDYKKGDKAFEGLS